MNSVTHFGFEDWLPRPTALLVALGVWVAGFAVAGAAAWRMHHEPAAPEMNGMSASGAATSSGPAGSTDPEGVVVMSQDEVVGHKAPSTGVASKQKP